MNMVIWFSFTLREKKHSTEIIIIVLCIHRGFDTPYILSALIAHFFLIHQVFSLVGLNSCCYLSFNPMGFHLPFLVCFFFCFVRLFVGPVLQTNERKLTRVNECIKNIGIVSKYLSGSVKRFPTQTYTIWATQQMGKPAKLERTRRTATATITHSLNAT